MSKRNISLITGLIIGGIVAVIVVDYLHNRPGRLGKNPYEFSVDEYTYVDPELINYKETKNLPVTGYKPEGIDVYRDRIWLAGENMLQVIGVSGVQYVKKEIEGTAYAISATPHGLFICFENHISKYTLEGEFLEKWDSPGRQCVFTSVAASENYLFVADAGNRRVLRYDFEGSLLGEFEGTSKSSIGHGFIIPSPNFDLVVNAENELWVVNPGKHALENYSEDGTLKASWQNSSMKIEGFTGCCNPAEIAVLPDGSFVTSEKGLIRIKIHDKAGKLKSVVAPPDKFEKEGKAPEVAVDQNGVIYALDFDRSMIRVFERN